MKLKECSALWLSKQTKHKKLICFGAGNYLIYVFSAFSDLKLEKKIDFIADNDPKKWGSFRDISGTKVRIDSPQRLAEIDLSKFIIVITATHHQEIFSQIQDITNNPRITCYSAPKIRNPFMRVFNTIQSALPLTDSIVMQGEGDTCENATSLARYIESGGASRKHRIYWLCDHPEKFNNTKTERFIQRKADLMKMTLPKLWVYCRCMNRSRYLIFENQFIQKKRDEQISVYLNHGSPPLKATKGKIELQPELNYAVCPSENCSAILCEQYGINKERLLYCGSPRTDCLFNGTQNKDLMQKLEIQKYSKVILWVPTFRQHCKNGRVDSTRHYESGMPVIESHEDWTELARLLSELDILLLIKPHLLQRLDILKIPCNSNIRFITQAELDSLNTNVYELMKLCTAMITDYSTIGFDYMLLNRMIGYTIDDMNDFSLGFSVSDPLNYMPGHKIRTVMDFMNFIRDTACNNDRFRQQRAMINEWVHGEFADGNNSKRLVQMLGL